MCVYIYIYICNSLAINNNSKHNSTNDNNINSDNCNSSTAIIVVIDNMFIYHITHSLADRDVVVLAYLRTDADILRHMYIYL